MSFGDVTEPREERATAVCRRPQDRGHLRLHRRLMAEGLGFQWRALQTRVPTVLGPPPSWSLCPRDFRPQPRGAGRGPQAHRAETGGGTCSGAGPCVTGGAWQPGRGCRGRGQQGGAWPSGRAQLGGRQRPGCAPGARGLAAAGGDVRLPRPQRPPGAARLSRLEWFGNGELAPALQSSAAVAGLRRRRRRRRDAPPSPSSPPVPRPRFASPAARPP